MTARPPSIAISYGGRVFHVSYDVATVAEPIKNSEDTLWLIAEDAVDSLITVSFEYDGGIRNVLFFTQLDSFGMDFGIFYQPGSQFLFLGGGKLSAVVDIQSMRSVHINQNSCMFWHFKEINGHIVEFGELNCYLYSANGKFLDECLVDPPYEYEVSESEIVFRSDVLGEQKLRFPTEV